jgi:hypothetical protein
VLLVADDQGRINHVTSKLTNRLGTQTSRLQAGGLTHAMDTLLPAALARLHHKVVDYEIKMLVTLLLDGRYKQSPFNIQLTTNSHNHNQRYKCA